MSVYCTCLSLLLAQLCVLGAARSAETSSHGEVFRSDYTYSQQAAGWLKLHRESVEWETARIKCHNEGAVLASPVDANMATALTQLLTQEELPNTEFFSGVSSPLRDGVYTSIEGIALNQLYGQWDIGQPNNWSGRNQHCITFIHYKYSEMLIINDEICTNKFPFICYRPAAAPNKLTAYKTVDKETPRGKEPCSDYTFSMEAAGWLKLHREEVNWQTAQLQCHHEGAVLASPLNADLAKALTKLLTQAELENSTKVFAGVLSVLADGVFTSIEGVALDQLYTEWNIGQPNRGIRQDCTTFSYYNDRDVMPINDEDCFETYPYICYRPASVSDNMTKCGTADKVSETRRDGNEFRSDYTFSQEAAGWLKLHRVPLDWQTAKLQCYHEGAVLASPLNTDLSTAMTMLLTQANLKNYTEFFSGVSSALEDGVFTSIEGVALDQLYTQWDLGQPNFADRNQHCITYFYYKDRDVLPINDETCSHMFPYICYRPASASDKLTECGTVDTEYKLDARTRHCYKFHRYAMEWPSAARVCQAEGGYLAVIDSLPEADLLVELFAAYPKETLLYISEDGHYSASIGFSKRSGKWWTVQGKPLEESGYHIWNKGEPNNALGKQQCGGLLRNGRLDDAYCDMAYPFICEKSPDSLLTTMGNFDESVY